MTTGSNSRSNHHPLYPRDDREALSALFDSALPADSARFTLKRLDHDAEWRDTCGRWQLIGDTMRGEAVLAAPADFAVGVMRALASERQAGITAATDSTSAVTAAAQVARLRRRWFGGAALAASVAVAAVLVVRPFSPSSTGPQVATEVASPTASDAGNVASTSAPVASQAPAPVVALAATDTTVSGTSRPVRTSRPAMRAARNAPAEDRHTVDQPPTVLAAAAAQHVKPFHPPVDEIVTRPWPRAVLSDGTAAGALTVGLHSGAQTSPSFYPFEPRLQSEPQTVAPPPAEPQR